MISSRPRSRAGRRPRSRRDRRRSFRQALPAPGDSWRFQAAITLRVAPHYFRLLRRSAPLLSFSRSSTMLAALAMSPSASSRSSARSSGVAGQRISHVDGNDVALAAGRVPGTAPSSPSSPLDAASRAGFGIARRTTACATLARGRGPSRLAQASASALPARRQRPVWADDFIRRARAHIEDDQRGQPATPMADWRASPAHREPSFSSICQGLPREQRRREPLARPRRAWAEPCAP